MSDAFVLGAGFSVAINGHMPTTDELGGRVLAVQKSIHHARVKAHSAICDGISCDWPVLRGPTAEPNFEVWLSALAEDQPHLLRPENDRRHALFTELAGVVATEVASAVDIVSRSGAPEWLLRLVALWHRSTVGVVTFNYDTLVEAALETAQIPDPKDEARALTHLQIGPSVVPWWNAGYGGTRTREGQTFRLYKLHGSTHWYWDESTRAADSIVQIGLRSMWGENGPRYDDAEREHRAPGKVPMIVPPTTMKSGYFDNPVIRHVWHSAYLSLCAARRVFVMGYSLPSADILVRSMLAASLTDSEVWIINPDREVGNRFGEMAIGDLRLDFCGHGPPDMDDVVARLGAES